MIWKRRIALVGFVTALLLATGVVSGAANGGGTSHNGNTLVGAWLVTIDRGSLGPLKSLQTYARGGVFTETANAVPNTMRGPGHGSWNRAGHRRFDTTQLFFRYDPATGAWTGYVKLRSRIQLDSGGDSLTATTVGQALDTNGNPVGPPRTDSAVGERLDVEPLPD